ncbi:MAG: hypothetical protein PHE89_00570 [Alphaproteobacteria bacterium]|nr:hypothetical protein [Alphaproteobacteria bacterium]
MIKKILFIMITILYPFSLNAKISEKNIFPILSEKEMNWKDRDIIQENILNGYDISLKDENNQSFIDYINMSSLSTKDKLKLEAFVKKEFPPIKVEYKSIDEMHEILSEDGRFSLFTTIPKPTDISSPNYEKLIKIYRDLLYINENIKRLNIGISTYNKDNLPFVYYREGTYNETVQKYLDNGDENEFLSDMDKHCIDCKIEDFEDDLDIQFKYTPENSSLCKEMRDEQFFRKSRQPQSFSFIDEQGNTNEIESVSEGTMHVDRFYIKNAGDNKYKNLRYYRWLMNAHLENYKNKIYIVNSDNLETSFDIYEFNPKTWGFTQVCSIFPQMVTKYEETLKTNDDLCNKIIKKEYKNFDTKIVEEDNNIIRQLQAKIKSVPYSNLSIPLPCKIVIADYNNDGIEDTLIQTDFASGSGRGCDHSFYSTLNNDNTFILNAEPYCNGAKKQIINIDNKNYILSTQQHMIKNVYEIIQENNKDILNNICNFIPNIEY